ncbi:MAG: hypothetical protein RIQ79_1249 [Verrucomicrobiota bacterium]
MPPVGMGNYGIFPALAGGIVESLIEASREIAAAKAKGIVKAKRSRGRSASHAADGALWRALAARVAPLLGQRGAQAKLGRELGVSRQQIYAYFKGRTAAPDAERVLRLIVWLALAEAEAAEKAKAAADKSLPAVKPRG